MRSGLAPARHLQHRNCRIPVFLGSGGNLVHGTEADPPDDARNRACRKVQASPQGLYPELRQAGSGRPTPASSWNPRPGSLESPWMSIASCSHGTKPVLPDTSEGASARAGAPL